MAMEQYEKIAIMFVDVEGSTKLYEKLGDRRPSRQSSAVSVLPRISSNNPKAPLSNSLVMKS